MMNRNQIEQIDFFGDKITVVNIKGDEIPKRMDKVCAVTLGLDCMVLTGYYSTGNDEQGNPKYIDMKISAAYDSIASIVIYGRELTHGSME
jgi:hypothetical protein